MVNPLEEIRTLIESKSWNADWIGVRSLTESAKHFSIRNGNPENTSCKISTGFFVEALVDGQFAYQSLPSPCVSDIRTAIERTVQAARTIAPYSCFKASVKTRPVAKGTYNTPIREPFATMTASEIFSQLKEAATILKGSAEIINAQASLSMVKSEMHLLSSSGSDLAQNFDLITTDLSATASRRGTTQTRSLNGHRGRSYQMGLEAFESQLLFDLAKRIRTEALELVSAPECPSGHFPLVLAPDQMMLQIHESIGHPLEIDRILGDELNFAGSSFVNLEDFGTMQYGSKLLNVTFDPSLPHEFASYAYDDTGFKAEKVELIRNGVLISGIGGLESQERSGIPAVACARASSWTRPCIDRMANINLEPGDSSLESILANIEFGVYMESNNSWSIDDFRRKFQFGCEYGRLIEKGKLTQVIRNPGYRGVTLDFWSKLDSVGDRSTFEVFGTPHCGKGEPNQLIRVGHASPVCRFDGIEVFGGGG
ncbi:MAG: TldD/PmbA family protein [Bdellovibrionales bacterium]|nr:TldD/PmbA family protein [Bdellovibrionales bacterium]